MNIAALEMFPVQGIIFVSIFSLPSCGLVAGTWAVGASTRSISYLSYPKENSGPPKCPVTAKPAEGRES